ncbi:MAG: hypothetical protein AAFZ92_05005 [Pseudomonadota bacterium]
MSSNNIPIQGDNFFPSGPSISDLQGKMAESNYIRDILSKKSMAESALRKGEIDPTDTDAFSQALTDIIIGSALIERGFTLNL